MLRRVCVMMVVVCLIMASLILPIANASKDKPTDIVVTMGALFSECVSVCVCVMHCNLLRSTTTAHQQYTVVANAAPPTAPPPRVVEEKTLAGKKNQPDVTVRYLTPKLDDDVDDDDDDEQPTIMKTKQIWG